MYVNVEILPENNFDREKDRLADFELRQIRILHEYPLLWAPQRISYTKS